VTWLEKVKEQENSFNCILRRSTTTTAALALTTAQAPVRPQRNEDEESPTKRQCTDTTSRKVTPEEIQKETFFDSDAAFRLFKPDEDKDSDPESCLKHRIGILRNVNVHVDGWRYVVKGRDPDNLCSDSDVFAIRQRCALLRQAYIFALQFCRKIVHNKVMHWSDVCQMACDHLNPSGIEQAARTGRQIQLWNRQFRDGDTFLHPCPHKKNPCLPSHFCFNSSQRQRKSLNRTSNQSLLD
jgi:hypothetical protein